MPDQAPLLLYIGNWDRHKTPPGNGLGICRFDPASGHIELVDQTAGDISVGAVVHDRQRDVLFVVDETSNLPGCYQGGGGQVLAMKIVRPHGQLVELSRLPSHGSLPSYLALDATGRRLVVVHHTDRVPATRVRRDADGAWRIALTYDDATSVLFPVRQDGAIEPPSHVHFHNGDGGPLKRQTHPQLHSVRFCPAGDFMVVCDKGNDELVPLKIDPVSGELRVCTPGAVKTPPGSSPRYGVFHPVQPLFFVNHETRAIVSSYRHDADGRLDLVCTVESLPDPADDCFEMKQSDLAIHPSGRWLYSLLRGISSVSVFEIDVDSGSLALRTTVRLDAEGPRGCAISPDGRFLVVAALDSREVTVWSIATDGSLAPTGRKINQPHPGTVTFC